MFFRRPASCIQVDARYETSLNARPPPPGVLVRGTSRNTAQLRIGPDRVQVDLVPRVRTTQAGWLPGGDVFLPIHRKLGSSDRFTAIGPTGATLAKKVEGTESLAERLKRFGVATGLSAVIDSAGQLHFWRNREPITVLAALDLLDLEELKPSLPAKALEAVPTRARSIQGAPVTGGILCPNPIEAALTATELGLQTTVIEEVAQLSSLGQCVFEVPVDSGSFFDALEERTQYQGILPALRRELDAMSTGSDAPLLRIWMDTRELPAEVRVVAGHSNSSEALGVALTDCAAGVLGKPQSHLGVRYEIGFEAPATGAVRIDLASALRGFDLDCAAVARNLEGKARPTKVEIPSTDRLPPLEVLAALVTERLDYAQPDPQRVRVGPADLVVFSAPHTSVTLHLTFISGRLTEADEIEALRSFGDKIRVALQERLMP